MSKSIYIIAEAGVNHNGSEDVAIGLIDAAIAAGVDAVKFQTFRSEALVSRSARKADYQARLTGHAEGQLEMLKRLELTEMQHVRLASYCAQTGIEFLSTPFDSESARFLADQIKISCLKIPSGEITNGPFLLDVARLGLPIVMSTGMSTLEEVEAALKILAFGFLEPDAKPTGEALSSIFASSAAKKKLRERVTLLHCTTEYPAPMTEVNLRCMRTMHDAFGLDVGYSDHTQGIEIPIAAAALGARIIEKHFTLDRTLPGPDHKASLQPEELAAMVSAIRNVELAMGDGSKAPTASEMGNRIAARRSLIALEPIGPGDLFTADNLGSKRPGAGVCPMRYWEFLGTSASKAYSADEQL